MFVFSSRHRAQPRIPRNHLPSLSAHNPPHPSPSLRTTYRQQRQDPRLLHNLRANSVTNRAKRKERPRSTSGGSGSSSGNGEAAQRRRGLLNSWRLLYGQRWCGRSVASSGVCFLAAMGSGMWRRGRDRRRRAAAWGAEPSAPGRLRRGPGRSPRAVKPGLTA